MRARLTAEQRSAIRRQGGILELEDEETNRLYVIVDSELHHRAMKALEERDVQQAIQAGIDDLEAGRVVPFAEVDARLRRKLGLPTADS
ncbi:MAG: hypothetical protein JSS02_13405 [Planctomycetes bacterium]|nr:hypothetical protein [Planctomycetota bacterium]